ncbi:MAG: hypothetical protein QM778_22070 [Myxococcales bacterium]
MKSKMLLVAALGLGLFAGCAKKAAEPEASAEAASGSETAAAESTEAPVAEATDAPAAEGEAVSDATP